MVPRVSARPVVVRVQRDRGHRAAPGVELGARVRVPDGEWVGHPVHRRRPFRLQHALVVSARTLVGVQGLH